MVTTNTLRTFQLRRYASILEPMTSVIPIQTRFDMAAIFGRKVKVMGDSTENHNAIAQCTTEAPRTISAIERAPLRRTRFLVAALGVQAILTFAFVTVAKAGPCTKEIEALQVDVDAIIESRADSGPTLPESQAAGLHHEPTPDSIAQAEAEAGEGEKGEQALAALARARSADHAGNAHLCRQALLDAKRAIAEN